MYVCVCVCMYTGVLRHHATSSADKEGRHGQDHVGLQQGHHQARRGGHQEEEVLQVLLESPKDLERYQYDIEREIILNECPHTTVFASRLLHIQHYNVGSYRNLFFFFLFFLVFDKLIQFFAVLINYYDLYVSFLKFKNFMWLMYL